MGTLTNSHKLRKLILATSVTCATCMASGMTGSPTQAQTKTKPPAKKKPAAKTEAKAEVTGPSDLVAAPSKATASTPVTTSAAAIQLIDLRQFPKLNPIQTLDDSATLVFYSAKGNVASAMAFLNSELANAGWKEVPDSVPDNPQYRDVLYTKSGYYLRLNVGESGDEGQISVNMSNLGNVDLSTLPRMPKTSPSEYTTPINATFETEQGMREAVKFCREELVKLGWQEHGGMHPGVPDVPHVKQLEFIKNAVRILVNVSRDPRLPNGNKTMVTYMAQHVLPHDLPLAANATEIKLDTYQNQAEYLTTSSIEEIVRFYRDQVGVLGWTPKTESEKVGDKAATLFMADEEKAGYVIAIRPTEEGPVKVKLERISFEKASEDENNEVAATEEEPQDDADDAVEDSNENEQPDPAELAINRMQQEIQNAVNKELQGVESKLGDLGASSDVMSLVEEAKRMANELEDSDDEDEEDDDDEDEDSSSESSEEAEAARQLAQKQSEADAALASLGRLETRCQITLGDTKHELKQGLAFRNPEDGSTVLMFCESPLNADKAERMLAQGEVPSIHDLMGRGFPSGMEIRLQEGMTWIGCFVDGNSINRGSSDFKNDFLAGSKRVRGTVTADPDEVFDKPFVFNASFDLPLLGKASGAGATPGTKQIVADPSYDLPVPDDCQGIGTEKTPYSSIITAQHEASVADLLAFYRQELTKKGYQENAAQSKTAADSANLQFTSSSGPVVLQLKRSGDTSEIQLTSKDSAKAKRDGIIPAAGQGLLLIANGSPEPITITLGKHVQKVAAGKGRDNPKDAARIPVLPGKHRVKIEMGGETKNEEITVEAGTTWGIFAVPELGAMVQPIY